MQITNEDNMQLMARYEDNYFDLAIVDPPYGINECGGKHRTKKIDLLMKSQKIYQSTKKRTGITLYLKKSISMN